MFELQGLGFSEVRRGLGLDGWDFAWSLSGFNLAPVLSPFASLAVLIQARHLSKKNHMLHPGEQKQFPQPLRLLRATTRR